MKKPLSGILAVGCCALLSLSVPAHLQAAEYTRGASGTWLDGAWEPTGVPLEDGDIAIISAGSSPRTLRLNADPTIMSMDVIGRWTLAMVDATPVPHTLTLRADPDAPGSSPFFYVGAANSQVANRDVAFTLANGITLAMEGGTFLLASPDRANGGTRAGIALFTVESGATLNVGTAAARSLWHVAQNYTSSLGSTPIKTTNLTAQAGSTVSAYLTELKVGSNNAPGNVEEISGTMDLSQATVTAFDVSGDVVIGNGTNHRTGSFGTVLLPEVEGRIGGHLVVGDSVAGTAGQLVLNGTHLDAEGDVTIDLTGQVKVILGEGAGGLKLSESSTLTINAFGAGAGDEAAGYFIDFTNVTLSDEGLPYGLAWEGNHLDDLTALINSHAITWVDSLHGPTAGAFYDASTNLTYIGYAAIPEPGTVSLLVGGVALLGWLGRRRWKSPSA